VSTDRFTAAEPSTLDALALLLAKADVPEDIAARLLRFAPNLDLPNGYVVCGASWGPFLCSREGLPDVVRNANQVVTVVDLAVVSEKLVTLRQKATE
jgi:hypothetical protein